MPLPCGHPPLPSVLLVFGSCPARGCIFESHTKQVNILPGAELVRNRLDGPSGCASQNKITFFGRRVLKLSDVV